MTCAFQVVCEYQNIFLGIVYKWNKLLSSKPIQRGGSKITDTCTLMNNQTVCNAYTGHKFRNRWIPQYLTAQKFNCNSSVNTWTLLDRIQIWWFRLPPQLWLVWVLQMRNVKIMMVVSTSLSFLAGYAYSYKTMPNIQISSDVPPKSCLAPT